ncbi:hypothetical protein ACFLS1_11495 [Verrucomicrobiota bacterium]
MKKKTRIIAASVILIIAVAVALPQITIFSKVLWGICVAMREIPVTKSRIMSADHAAILSACRELMATRSETEMPTLPTCITSLHPGHIFFEDDRMRIVFFSGHYHLWLEAFPEGQNGPPGYGGKELVSGLWLVEN